MRLNYYEFPEGVSDEVLKEAGCSIEETLFLVEGSWKNVKETLSTVSKDDMEIEEAFEIMDDLPHVSTYSRTLGGITVTYAKQLLKKYGGAAWTAHIDRDGGCFETTPIELKGNNSRFTYNRHL